MLKCLSDKVKTQPQAAFNAFGHEIFSRWAYGLIFFRTCPVSQDQVKPLEDALHDW